MQDKPQYINGKPVTPEAEYRQRLRMVARILDYQPELLSMGYEEEALHMFKKDVRKGTAHQNRLIEMFGSFRMKDGGREKELLSLLSKYDDLLKNCKDNIERKAVGTMGVIEIHKLLNAEMGYGNRLTVDGVSIINDAAINNKKGE